MGLHLILLLAAAAVSSPPVPSPPTVEAPVLARPVEKGETLSAADFTAAALSPGAARGALPARDAAGREAIRRLSAGSPVRATDIVAPRVVRRGEGVTITLASGALRITTAGRALSDGARGDAVRVLNLGTNRTLDAVADAPGQVRVAAQ